MISAVVFWSLSVSMSVFVNLFARAHVCLFPTMVEKTMVEKTMVKKDDSFPKLLLFSIGSEV